MGEKEVRETGHPGQGALRERVGSHGILRMPSCGGELAPWVPGVCALQGNNSNAIDLALPGGRLLSAFSAVPRWQVFNPFHSMCIAPGPWCLLAQDSGLH